MQGAGLSTDLRFCGLLCSNALCTVLFLKAVRGFIYCIYFQIKYAVISIICLIFCI